MQAAVLAAWMLLPSGCWSNKEIETQSLQIAVALDLPHPTKVERGLDAVNPDRHARDYITNTFQLIIPGQVGKIGGSTSEELSTRPYRNISQTGESVFGNVRELAKRISTPPLGHHLKVIIISDALAKRYDIASFLDFYFRDNDIRLSPLILISRGEAGKTLESDSQTDIPGFQIPETVRNRFRSNKILPPVQSYELLSMLRSKKSFLLQTVVKSDSELEYRGAAIVKGESGKIAGYLSDQELEAASWIWGGNRRGGVLKLGRNLSNVPIDMEIGSIQSSIAAKESNGRFHFLVDVEGDGEIMEDWRQTAVGKYSDAYYRGMERKLEEEVKQNIESLLDQLQSRYHADPLEFHETVRRRMPRTWKKVQEHWDEHFSAADVEVRVRIHLAGHGASELS